MGFFCAARPNCLCWFGACMEQALSARGGKALEEGKEEKEAVYDRLYSNAIRSERLRKEVLSRIKVQEELQGCTFAPQVSRVWSRVRGRAGVCTCVCELRDANVRFFGGGWAGSLGPTPWGRKHVLRAMGWVTVERGGHGLGHC